MISSKTLLSIPAAGLVERYNGPQKPWPLPDPQEDLGETAIKAERKRENRKTWSEEKDTISKESGCRHAPGLLLGRPLQSVCLTGQNKPFNRAWAILENIVHDRHG